MPLYVLVRKRTGEVEHFSSDPIVINERDLYITLKNPTLTDGSDLAIKKRWDGTSIRNATGQERTQFEQGRALDDVLVFRREARKILEENPVLRRVLLSMIDTLLVSINQLRGFHSLPIISLQSVMSNIFSGIDSGQYD
jgi:hypothetical protein